MSAYKYLSHRKKHGNEQVNHNNALTRVHLIYYPTFTFMYGYYYDCYNRYHYYYHQQNYIFLDNKFYTIILRRKVCILYSSVRLVLSVYEFLIGNSVDIPVYVLVYDQYYGFAPINIIIIIITIRESCVPF